MKKQPLMDHRKEYYILTSIGFFIGVSKERYKTFISLLDYEAPEYVCTREMRKTIIDEIEYEYEKIEVNNEIVAFKELIEY